MNMNIKLQTFCFVKNKINSGLPTYIAIGRRKYEARKWAMQNNPWWYLNKEQVNDTEIKARFILKVILNNSAAAAAGLLFKSNRTI